MDIAERGNWGLGRGADRTRLNGDDPPIRPSVRVHRLRSVVRTDGRARRGPGSAHGLPSTWVGQSAFRPFVLAPKASQPIPPRGLSTGTLVED